MEFGLKENLIVIEYIRIQWISSNMSTNCPSPLSIIYFKDRVSRNIVGVRKLVPEIKNFMDQLFIFFSFIIIICTLMVIISVNPMHSIFWVVLLFINSAGLLITMNFDFLGLILMIIYVGAITILFLFVIMMLDIFQIKKIQNFNHLLIIILLSLINSYIQLNELIANNFNFMVNSTNNHWNFKTINHITNINSLLYTEFFYPLIILSILLFIAMIGAIILTLETNIITRKQKLSNQHKRNNSWI